MDVREVREVILSPKRAFMEKIKLFTGTVAVEINYFGPNYTSQ